MRDLQLSRPTFKIGKRTVTIAWNEPLDNYGEARGVGACTVALTALESVAVSVDACSHEMIILRLFWPGHSLVAHMIDFPDVHNGISEDDVERVLSAAYAAGRERCQEIATRLREAMEKV